MHQYFVTRGVDRKVTEWKNAMQSQYFPWKRFNMNVCSCNHSKKEHKEEKSECLFTKCACMNFVKREETTMIQGVLRPVQFWEYVHPKESFATVYAMQHSKQQNSTLLDQYKDMRSEMKPFAWAIRKALGLQKLPDDLKESGKYFVPGYGVPYTKNLFSVNNVPIDGVGIYPCGWKEDVYGENELFGFEQEMI